MILSPKYIYSLKSLFGNDVKTINDMCNDIKSRGFTFLSFASYDDLKKSINNSVDEMNYFFGQDNNYKTLYSKEPINGYFNVQHKENYRLLTGCRMKEHRIPNNMVNTIAITVYV